MKDRYLVKTFVGYATGRGAVATDAQEWMNKLPGYRLHTIHMQTHDNGYMTILITMEERTTDE